MSICYHYHSIAIIFRAGYPGDYSSCLAVSLCENRAGPLQSTNGAFPLKFQSMLFFPTMFVSGTWKSLYFAMQLNKEKSRAMRVITFLRCMDSPIVVASQWHYRKAQANTCWCMHLGKVYTYASKKYLCITDVNIIVVCKIVQTYVDIQVQI